MGRPLIAIGVPFRRGGFTQITNDYITRVYAEGGTLTDVEKSAINELTLNPDIAEFDRLWVHGLQNEIAARTSVVNALTADLITNVNSTTFTAGEGFQGNGTTMYLDTNYNPAVDGVKYTQNSASFGNHSLLGGVINDSLMMGVNNGIVLNYHSPTHSGVGGAALWTINNHGTNSTGASLQSDGFFAVTRISSNESHYYKNGVDIYSDLVSTSGGLVNFDFYLLARNNNGTTNNFSTHKIAFSFIGSGAIDQSSFYDSIKPLVDGAGEELYRGLIAGYNLDGDATSATGQYNGTPTNITYLSGKKGLAASFNGTTSKIAIGRPLNKAVGTVSFWVNSSFLLNNIGRPISDSFGNLYFEISAPNIVKFNLYDNSLKELSTTFLLDTWVNIVGVYDGTNIKLYKNGGFINQTPAGAIESVNYDCFLGTNGSAPTTFFNGLLDMVGFWNRPLTPEEITILYNNGNGALKSNK